MPQFSTWFPLSLAAPLAETRRRFLSMRHGNFAKIARPSFPLGCPGLTRCVMWRGAEVDGQQETGKLTRVMSWRQNTKNTKAMIARSCSRPIVESFLMTASCVRMLLYSDMAVHTTSSQKMQTPARAGQHTHARTRQQIPVIAQLAARESAALTGNTQCSRASSRSRTPTPHMSFNQAISHICTWAHVADMLQFCAGRNTV